MPVAEQNKDVIRRFFAEIDRRNFAVVDETYAADCRIHLPFSPDPIDRATLRGLVEASYITFPDLTNSIDAQIAEEDTVVTRWTFRGTNLGEFEGRPATGRAVKVSGITMERLESGRVVERWTQGDYLGLLQQLGVLPTG